MNIADFRADLLKEKAYKSYAKLEDWYEVNRYYLWHMVNDETYEPPIRIMLKLGIAAYRPAPVCLKCGQVHVTKRCTANHTKHRSLFSWPVKDLRKALEHREEML